MSNDQLQQKRIEEGPPIWVESCLSPEDYRKTAKKFKNVFTNGPIAVSYVTGDYKGGKWRANMGGNLDAYGIKLINDRIDILRKMIINGRQTDIPKTIKATRGEL